MLLRVCQTSLNSFKFFRSVSCGLWAGAASTVVALLDYLSSSRLTTFHILHSLRGVPTAERVGLYRKFCVCRLAHILSLCSCDTTGTCRGCSSQERRFSWSLLASSDHFRFQLGFCSCVRVGLECLVHSVASARVGSAGCCAVHWGHFPKTILSDHPAPLSLWQLLDAGIRIGACRYASLHVWSVVWMDDMSSSSHIPWPT